VPVVAVVTLLLTGLLVVALAAYLVWVVLLLRRIVATLGQVASEVRTIASRTEPVGPVLAEVNADLTAVAEALEALAARAGRPVETSRAG
jgi:hypothetical protein